MYYWFQPRRKNAPELTLWIKRGFLATQRCFPRDLQ